MSRNKNLDTLVKNERKIITMVPGRLSLRPKGKRVVQLNDGSFANINDDGLAIETQGDMRMGYNTRLLDPTVPRDAEILAAVEELLERRPEYRTYVDYQISIRGEFDPVLPWPGYDEQNSEQVEATYMNLPDKARPKLEEVMKYELERVDENGESITNDDKVKVLNKLHRLEEQSAKVAAEDTVAM